MIGLLSSRRVSIQEHKARIKTQTRKLDYSQDDNLPFSTDLVLPSQANFGIIYNSFRSKTKSVL
jgi:hypothetical protein